MSCSPPASTKSNQFIRPKIDIHSAATRLVSSSEGFTNSIDAAIVISGGVPVEFVNVMMLALGNLNDALSTDDMWAILDLYTTAPSTCKEEDAAVEIPFSAATANRGMDTTLASPEGKALSSLKDKPSYNGTQLGEGMGRTHIMDLIKEPMLPTARIAGVHRVTNKICQQQSMLCMGAW